MTMLTDYRNAVKALVEEITGIKVKPGKFDGPVRNGDLGCIYPVSVVEDANVTREILEVRVRLFLNCNAMDADPEIPLDPSPLEDLIEKCQEHMSEGSQAFGGVWFGRLTEAEVNMEWYGIEFAVRAYAWNKFAVVAPT